MHAGERDSVGQPEIQWAREYEKSLIPQGTRFPRKGDVYGSKLDQTVSFMTAWAAPYTGSGEATLFEGERVWIDHEPVDEEPIGVYALPVEYEKLEQRMVPAEDRDQQSYGGFYFSFKTLELSQNFTLVQTGYDGEGEVPTADDVPAATHGE